jgi:hypothetical protein
LDAATAEHYVTETMRLGTKKVTGSQITYEYDFKIEVGADGNGSPATRVKVIEDMSGQIHGFPY